MKLESSEWLVVSGVVGGGGNGKPLPTNLEDLSQDRLKKLITAVSETRKKKYGRNNTKKYGNLNKGFTDEELNKFFKFCSHPKAYACFYLMANLGLRVGEVVNK